MAVVPQKTLNWLWDVLRREYRDPQRAYSDVVQTLSIYPTFAPRTDVYTFENGTSALLLRLNGTIPVSFRGASYQFPIAVWIPQNYPTESPLLYVTPTEGMVIRPGQHVSGSDGRVYHPYLARWREAWERSTIVDFLKILTDIFAREPPVMSRQQMPSVQQQATPQVRQQQHQPPSRPPPPIEQRPSSARPLSMVTPSTAPPPPPPKGDRGLDSTRPTSTASPELRKAGRYETAPPLPPATPSSRPEAFSQQSREGYSPQYQNQRTSSVRQSYPPQLSQQQTPLPIQRYSIAGPPPQQYVQQQPQQSQQPQTQQQRSIPSIQHQKVTSQPYSQQQLPNTQPPQVPKQYQIPQSQQPYPPTAQSQNSFHPSAPLPQVQQQAPLPKPKPQEPNLMDESPFDISLNARTSNLPTPAIPPNPEKQHLLDTLSSALLQNLHEQISQSTSALPLLVSQQQALLTAQATLQSELQGLQTLHSQLSSNVSALNTTLASADRVISNAKKAKDGKGVPNIDECVIPPTVVARQLYDAVAEQRGYEAAIYALTDGFVRGRMESKVWERKTREFAREEFKRKWLVKRRLAWGLGLDTSVLDY